MEIILVSVCLSLTHAAPEGMEFDIFAESQYQNNYDQPLDVRCGTGAGMHHVQSVYDGGHRDRRWTWHCKSLKLNANTQCAFTDYVNHFDEPMYFMCGSNQYFAGVYSYHDNGREDRRWRFTCCSTQGLNIYGCRLAGYANGFHTHMNFQVGPDEVITGAYGYHRNDRE